MQRVRNENTGTARDVQVIVAVTVSLIGISIAVAGSMLCLCRKRRLKRKQTDQDSLSVAFRAAEVKAGVANGVPNIYVNRAFMHSDEMFEEDEEIKEGDNPLYSSRVETEQDQNQNVLYESMDEVSQNIIEAETVNPVYERFA